MQITPDKLRFELIINGISTDITDYVSNWENIKIDYTRDDLKGVYINISNSIDFIGTAYSMLDGLYSANSFNANAVFVVSLRNDVLDPSLTLWAYSELKRVDLDFSTFKRTDYVISLNAKSNSLADLIKANKGTVYDIPVSELSPSDFNYDRLELTDEYYLTIMPYNENYIIGLNPNSNVIPLSMEISEDNLASDKIKQSSDGKRINILESGDYSIKGSALLYTDSTEPEARVFVDFQIMHHRPNTPNEILTVLYNNNSGTGFDIDVDFNIQNFPMIAGDYITINIPIYTDSPEYPGPSNVFIYFKDSSKFTFSYSVKALPVTFDCISLQSLISNILYKIAGSGYTATVNTGLSNDIRLVSAESVRGFSNAKFHTSFEQFYNSMRAVFGLEYDISGNTIAFKPRSELFKDTKAIDITDVTDLELSVNTSHIYSSLKIGFKKVDYNKVNGKDEFRFTNEFSSGVTVSTKKLELISDYRADAWGIEFLVQSRGEDTTDDQSDNDVFFLDCALNGSNLVPSRVVPITGVISPTTMFNVIFSPRNCLLRNALYLGISSSLFTFASSEGLSNIVINGVYENSNVTVNSKLFLPDTLKFKVGEISALPSEKDGYVEFVYKGITHQGYIKELNHFIGKDQETTWTLFCKQKAIITLMYINSEKEVITDIDTSTTFNINDNAELEVTQYEGDTDDYILNENGELILIY